MSRGRGGVAVAVVLLALAACGNGGNLSDRDLLEYASRPYNKREMMDKRVALGVHKGTPVVAEFPCSDICPDYTVRVIRYELAPGETCSERGGVQRGLVVPVGIAAMERTFCFPRVLAENWESYKN